MENKLLTIKEVAEQLRLSTKTIYGLIKEGKLYGIVIGKRKIFVPLEKLEEYLNNNKKG